ncbi:MAG: DegT/DnrJ/EryC1/StrS family aminotransferase, partial [Acidobacteriaceae bacterium]|nr:DegT/DnrJ/EryC1/StrS family aminotransferase [Acidobacteriaceae bacterium]
MNGTHRPILLSVPHMSGLEMAYVQEAFDTNWLSSVGPNIDRFEEEFSRHIGVPSVAVSSGTAAIHLGLRILNVGPGDYVFCSTFTFAASANPILYQGASPVFIDSDRETWNMDPNLLETALRQYAACGSLPKTVIVVHLYGQCADMDAINAVCARYGIPVLEDAAEALGASYRGKPAGTFGAAAAFSFNGNKMITTTSGGMVVCREQSQAEKIRFWATQARDKALWYQHS